ncbi:hypothetical protein BXZ70DRAFT_909791 [Cristinia sonorae]|uniref:Uncharacterized protein n=1 Tax=Cristinia sonorae TaxID=1940300 RepID=A0A8K0UJK9_9AGAR|nr:hypothetical protein BXZ70DRAFT_909791 [Cristinia sonorae]
MSLMGWSEVMTGLLDVSALYFSLRGHWLRSKGWLAGRAGYPHVQVGTLFLSSENTGSGTRAGWLDVRGYPHVQVGTLFLSSEDTGSGLRAGWLDVRGYPHVQVGTLFLSSEDTGSGLRAGWLDVRGYPHVQVGTLFLSSENTGSGTRAGWLDVRGYPHVQVALYFSLRRTLAPVQGLVGWTCGAIRTSKSALYFSLRRTLAPVQGLVGWTCGAIRTSEWTWGEQNNPIYESFWLPVVAPSRCGSLATLVLTRLQLLQRELDEARRPEVGSENIQYSFQLPFPIIGRNGVALDDKWAPRSAAHAVWTNSPTTSSLSTSIPLSGGAEAAEGEAEDIPVVRPTAHAMVRTCPGDIMGSIDAKLSDAAEKRPGTSLLLNLKQGGLADRVQVTLCPTLLASGHYLILDMSSSDSHMQGTKRPREDQTSSDAELEFGVSNPCDCGLRERVNRLKKRVKGNEQEVTQLKDLRRTESEQLQTLAKEKETLDSILDRERRDKIHWKTRARAARVVV